MCREWVDWGWVVYDSMACWWFNISHKDPQVVYGVLNLISSEFKDRTPFTIDREKDIDYLWIIIDLSKTGKVILNMNEYVEKIVNKFEKEITKAAKPQHTNIYLKWENLHQIG